MAVGRCRDAVAELVTVSWWAVFEVEELAMRDALDALPGCDQLNRRHTISEWLWRVERAWRSRCGEWCGVHSPSFVVFTFLRVNCGLVESGQRPMLVPDLFPTTILESASYTQNGIMSWPCHGPAFPADASNWISPWLVTSVHATEPSLRSPEHHHRFHFASLPLQ